MSTESSRSRSYPGWLLGLLLVAATVLAYQQAWHAGFIWDDDRYVTHNALLTAPDGLHRIWFSFDSPSQYFPLIYTTFRAEHALWGLNPAGYHWVNLLLHAMNALLAWRLLRRLAIPGAWLAAAIFALHPVNVESVAWVAELKNVQSFFFLLLALHAWVRFLEEPPRWRWYALSLACYVPALFSKTTSCTLPVALLLILWLKQKPITRWRIAQMIPYVACGIAMGLVSVFWERSHQGIEGHEVFTLGYLERLLVASRAAWFYIGKLLWPANLMFIYPSWTIERTAPLAYAGIAAGVGLIIAIVFARRRLGRSVEVATLYYLATLGPMLGFVMLYTFQYKFVADHYQYVASLGPIALFAAGAATLLENKPVWLKSALAAVVMIALGTLTWQQCGRYSDLETLWRTTLTQNPNSFLVLNNLGEVLLDKGRPQEAVGYFERTLKIKPQSAKAHSNLGVAFWQSGKPDEAIRELETALQIQPELAEAHKNLSDVFIAQGRVDEAMAHALKAVTINPEFPEAQNNLGNALLQAGHVDEAIVHLQKALELRPDFPNALNNLGVAMIQKGNVAEATALFQRTIEILPGFAQAHHNLGKLQLLGGNAREAIARYEAALKIQPGDPETLSNLAWVLATWPDAPLRNGPRALELAQQANELTRGESPAVLGTLAAAFAEIGRFTEAVTTAQRALQIAEIQSNAPLVAQLRSQLKHYQTHSPHRDNGKPEGVATFGGP